MFCQKSVRVVGGLGCGWVKLNVLQKRWLACRLAALLILRSVGNFRLFVGMLNVCRVFVRVADNVPALQAVWD
jgi:hypothetical protein